MRLLFVLILGFFTGCSSVNKPLQEGEDPMPLLDFQNGQFWEIRKPWELGSQNRKPL